MTEKLQKLIKETKDETKINISINDNTIFVYVTVFGWIYFDLSVQWPDTSPDTNYGIFCNTCVDILFTCNIIVFLYYSAVSKKS